MVKYLFIDFDRTIFDTDSFYNHLEQAVLVDQIKDASDLNLAAFVYPDTISFIWNARQAGYLPYLITYGDRTVQQTKVRMSGLESLFVNVFYVEQGSKGDFIRAFLNSFVSCEDIAFIDDLPEHINGVRTRIPQSKTFLICRPGAKRAGQQCDGLQIVESLSAVIPFL